MEFYCLEPQDPQWPELLQHVRHDVYHLPQYVALEAQRTGTRGFAFLTREKDQLFFVPYLIRACPDLGHAIPCNANLIFDVTSPYGYPGIILNDSAKDNPNFIKKSLELFINILSEKNICSAFIRFHPILGESFANLLSPSLIVKTGRTIAQDLKQSESVIWAQTRRGHQSSINKCKRLGYQMSIVPIEAYLGEFIDIYKDTMQRVSAQKFYFFDQNYFSSLLQLKEYVHLCIAQLKDQVISAMILFECCGIVQAHLGGTKTEFLTDSPSMAILNYGRYWAKERGNEFFHLGGGIGGSDQDSLYRFKKGFSRLSYPFFTLRLVIKPDLYDALVNAHADQIQVSRRLLAESNFFPAYRTSF